MNLPETIWHVAQMEGCNSKCQRLADAKLGVGKVVELCRICHTKGTSVGQTALV